MVHILDKESSILNKFLAEIRDVNIQGDSMRFRRNLERIAEICAYEISRTLDYSPQIVETPLGEADVMLSTDKVVLATILRAGLHSTTASSTTSMVHKTPLLPPTANTTKMALLRLRWSTFRVARSKVRF